MSDQRDPTVTLELEDGYRFRADFGLPGVPSLVMDEPDPLGAGAGPNATRVLAAAVGNCLSASALYCMRRARLEVRGMRTTVAVSLARNEAGRQRIGRLKVRIEPEVDDASGGRLRRCLEIFEDYCVVTESVRGGIEVGVDVDIKRGRALAATAGERV